VTLTSEQEGELRSCRREEFTTRRVSVAALEEILYEPFPVLDHGFVRVIDYMGDDGSVVQAGFPMERERVK